MTQIFFDVFTPLVPLNKLLHMCWQARKRLQDTLNSEVAAAVLVHDPEIPKGFLGAKKKRVVVITLYRKKLQDPDNLVGSVKPLVDALKKAWLIYDDSPEWLTLRVHQAKCEEQKTYVEIRGQA